MVKIPEVIKGFKARWAALGVDITEEMRRAEEKVETDMLALTAMLKAEYNRGVMDGIDKGLRIFNERTYARAKAEGLIDPSEVD